MIPPSGSALRSGRQGGNHVGVSPFGRDRHGNAHRFDVRRACSRAPAGAPRSPPYGLRIARLRQNASDHVRWHLESLRNHHGRQLQLVWIPGERDQRPGGLARCGRGVRAGYARGQRLGNCPSIQRRRVRCRTTVGEIGDGTMDGTVRIRTLCRILAGVSGRLTRRLRG